MAHNLEQGDIVMCTVERIAGTVVFVNIDGNGTGSIILSEIAPGRIRNLRNYVVPKKRIICKVLRTSGDHVDLSLRRVTPKEQKEIKEKYKLEKSYESVIKTILGKKADELIKEIKKDQTLYEFLEGAKENPKILEKIIPKKDSDKILEIVKKQKKREVEVKKDFKLHSKNPDGLKTIKEVLGKVEDATIKYISAGKYTIKINSEEPKKADTKIREILKDIEKNAKKQGAEVTISEK